LAAAIFSISSAVQSRSRRLGWAVVREPALALPAGRHDRVLVGDDRFGMGVEDRPDQAVAAARVAHEVAEVATSSYMAVLHTEIRPGPVLLHTVRADTGRDRGARMAPRSLTSKENTCAPGTGAPRWRPL
jgi:hypothetical protein